MAWLHLSWERILPSVCSDSVFHRFAWLGLCSSFTWVAGFSLAGAGGGAWPDLCLVV